MARSVIVYEWVKPESRANFEPRHVKQEKGPAVFLEFGIDFQQFDDGAVPFTSAIVEFPDGTVDSVSVDLIRFNDPLYQEQT